MFIVFEGMDGTGKTTVMREIYQWMLEHPKRSIAMKTCLYSSKWRENSPSPFVSNLLFGENGPELSPDDQMHLFGILRGLISNNVVEALLHKKHVLIDRWTPSMAAYQVAGLGGDPWVHMDVQYAIRTKKPDVTFLLDIPVDVALERIKKRGEEKDRFGNKDRGYYERVAESYKTQMICWNEHEDGTMWAIDANNDIDKIVKDIKEILEIQYFENIPDWPKRFL